MKLLTRTLGLVFLLSGALAAQDVTGRWSGVADSTDEAGTKRMERQTLEIKSENGKYTGTRVNRAGTGGSALDIQVDGAKVNLYEFLPLDGGEPLRWKLELKDGKLVGTFSAQHHNPKKWIYDRIGTMTLTRVEAPAAVPAGTAVPPAPAK